MKLSLSQNSYEIRDASEIAFGILVLAIVLAPAAFLIAFLLVVAVGTAVSVSFSSMHMTAFAVILWIGAMVLVVRRYRKVAGGWTEELRGSDMLHFIEWICVGLGLLTSVVFGSQNEKVGKPLKLFLSSLMSLLLLSHVVTYCMLRYRPRKREIIVWLALGSVSLYEFYRNA
jgi:hypothetical protein